MKPFIIYSGSEGQVISDNIKKDGRPFEIPTGSTVKFYMREADSETLKVDESATIVDALKGEVKYTWIDADLDTQGNYFGWWSVLLPNSTNVDTEEFEIIITTHAPGIRTKTGAIYTQARSIIPYTWNALENSDKYGDKLLQNSIEIVKLSVFNEVVTVEEESALDFRVQNYLAKLAVIQVVPAGVDYWMNQHTSLNATGTNESVTYPDRVAALWKVYERLLGDIRSDQALIEQIIGIPSYSPNTGAPSFSEGTDEGFVTPLPSKNFIDYAFPKNRGGVW